MIDRQSCFQALFELKDNGIDVTEQLNLLSTNRGIPYEVIEFLRNNSPQFQFYRYIQKYQKALAKDLLDYEELDNNGKIIVSSSFITRAYIAIKCHNINEQIIEDLNLADITDALNIAISSNDLTELDEVMIKHSNYLRTFYKNEKVKNTKKTKDNKETQEKQKEQEIDKTDKTDKKEENNKDNETEDIEEIPDDDIEVIPPEEVEIIDSNLS